MADEGVVMDQYIIPLIYERSERKGGCIGYYGPDEDVEEILSACGDITDVVGIATEGSVRKSDLQRLLDLRYPRVRYRVHIGNTRELISTNIGRHSEQHVSTRWEDSVNGHVWGFDIVCLDHCEHIPIDLGRDVFRALSRPERQDAWQPWSLVLSFHPQALSTSAAEALCSFLKRKKGSASAPVAEVVEFLVDGNAGHREHHARLIHGYMSYILAEELNMRVTPRPTLMYYGPSDGPMLCIVYELGDGGVVPDQQNPLTLLRSPILQVREDRASPWFELLPDQPPGQTEDDVRNALDFLPEPQLDNIISDRFT